MNFETQNTAKKESKFVGFLKSFSTKQLVWFIFGVLVALTGLAFLICGLIDDYADIKNSILTAPNNGMRNALKLSFTWFGVIVFAAGTIIYSVALSLASKSEDRAKEKETRREQRLKAMKEKNAGVVLNFEGTSSASEAKPE